VARGKEKEELSIFVSGPHVEFYKYFQLFLGSTESFSGQPIIQGDNRKEINSCFFAIPDFMELFILYLWHAF
jgi:hypothetical protein